MGTTGQSITLANSIIGVGILAMPFCFQQCGVLLATLILLFMGLISRLCCYFLLKSALLARRRNFEFLAFHVFGQLGKFAVEVGIIGFLMGTCIAYFVVVGDLGPQIVAKMFNINQSDILRTSIMVIVSLVCVLPLGLLRNVDSLSNVSAATIAFYFCLVMKVITEAASQLMTSDWHRRVEMWRPAGLLQCVPIFSMALFCQTQLFEIFESLPTLSLEKMNVVTKNAINICTGVYFTLGVFGYIAFSSQDISGNILMSLSPTMASDVIKLGFVMSLAFSFPLIIFPCRASLYSFLYKKVHSSHHDHIINHSIPETTFRCITVAIIAVTLFISLLIPNIELVLGLVGSTIGVLICVVFPAACFINVTFKNTNERVLAKGVLVLGLFIMVLGTYANLQAAENKLDRYDEKYTQERIDKIVEDFFEKRNKDNGYFKIPPKTEPISNESHKSLVHSDIIKDSEVQPPNPIPPESHSNEKLPETKGNIINNEKKQMNPLPNKELVDKSQETHPRDLRTKLDAQIANGIKNEEIKKPKEPKPQSNEDKIDMIKQQKLIETIKQHGEEQKELIKEQKEILDEIIKTKKELQQNKNEMGSNEAKKIAVESIKQIANMAIQSIGGVSEKPDLKTDVKAERLEKLTNEAVQEIAKKAAETIEAIQEIKEKPEQANGAQPVVNNVHNPPVQNSVPINPPVQNNVPIAQPVQNNVPNVQPIQNNVPNVQPVQSNVPDVQPIQNNIPNPQVVQNIVPNAQILQNNNVNAQVVQNSVPNAQPIQNNAAIAPPAQNIVPVQNNIQNAKTVKANPAANVPAIQNAQQAPVNAQNIQAANPQLKPVEAVNNVAANVNSLANDIKVNKDVAPAINPPINKEAHPAVNEKPKEPILPNVVNQAGNKPVQVEKRDAEKPHSHSPDEPQSYKQGEDAQIKQTANKIVQNIPIVNELANNQIKIDTAAAQKVNSDDDIKVNVQPKIQNVDTKPVISPKVEPVLVRQKREVVDCSQKVNLKPEDKEICDTLVDRPKIKETQDFLKDVDMNDVALPKSLPLDLNALHLVGRSLKSYDKDER